MGVFTDKKGRAFKLIQNTDTKESSLVSTWEKDE